MDSHSRLKTFVLPKDIVKKIKSHAKSEGNFHKIFLTKSLTPGYIKNSYNSIRKRQTSLLFKMEERFKQHFAKDDIHMTNKYR